MREDDSNWFTKWEEQLPSPEDLIPLSHSLISPNLALAFNIQIPNTESPDLSSGATGDESARTLKRPRLVWTPQLHKRFVDAVAHLGIKNAVPKTIMNLMSVDGLTRENVASHLQKYRLYLKRISSGGGGGAGSDPATDRLFASSPVPAHFLHQNRGSNSDHYIPSFVPHLQPPQFHRQIAAAHFGSPINGQFNSPTNVKFDPLLLQTQQQSIHRMSTPSLHSPVGNYVDDLESVNGGRTVLTLFPNRDD